MSAVRDSAGKLRYRICDCGYRETEWPFCARDRHDFQRARFKRRPTHVGEEASPWQEIAERVLEDGEAEMEAAHMECAI